MYELALFAGGGGSILGGMLCGWTTVCGVEINPYCREILLRRQEEGYLPPFPIWGNIRTFTKRNNQVRPVIKILRRTRPLMLTAGFPCQPFSFAGKRLGERDKRNLWPETVRVIQEVRPDYVLLENVPGIASYLPTIYAELRRVAFCPHPPIYASAAGVGAGHIRNRVWIFAHRRNEEQWENSIWESTAQEKQKFRRPACAGNVTEIFADSDKEVQLQLQGGVCHQRERIEHYPWWLSEPGVGRVVYGLAYRMDRIESLGEGQIPAVVRVVWEIVLRIAKSYHQKSF